MTGGLIPFNNGGGALSESLNRPITSDHYEMGNLLGHQIPFDLSEEQLSTHSCVLGATGSGKSKFIELLMRYLVAARRGFCLIDPHGDLSEDILAYAAGLRASKRDREVAKRIHYLEPSFESTFSFDPFKFRPSKPIPEHFKPNAYSAWLRAKADRVAEIFQRKQNQPNFEGMPRLQRVLTDVLIAAGTIVDGDTDDRLSLADAMILLDFTKANKDQHLRVFARIRPFLEPEIAADFERLQGYNSDEQRLREIESTINRLRSLFSPIVKAIFSRQAESIDFRSIIQNGEILLVNLRETDYFSADQRRALGGLFIHEILTTAQNEDREVRRPFHLIIDEAGDFVGEDISHALGIMRKFKLSICLAAQDLSSFKKGDLDMRSKVLSQCGTKVCFNQSWPDDLEILARVLGTGNLKFEKHYQIVDRPDGYNWHKVQERSESKGNSTNWSDGTSTQQSTTRSKSDSESSTSGYSSSETKSKSTTEGTSKTRKTDSKSREHIVDSSSETIGQAVTRGESSGFGQSHTEGRSETFGSGASHSDGGGESSSESISYKLVPLPRYRTELHEQPSLRNLVSDQLEQIKQTLHSLAVGEAVVKIRNEVEAVLIKTAHVSEPWHPDDKFPAIAKMKELCQDKPYFSVPDFTPQASEGRISQFLATEEKASPRPPAPGASPVNPFDT